MPPHSPTVRDLIDTLTQRLDAQATQIDALKTEAQTQFQRIAQMQAELDVLPTAHQRREALRARLDSEGAHTNGSNGSGRT